MSTRTIKVKYIGGKGLELGTPLSDGRAVFYKGEIYEIKEEDYIRLMSGSYPVFEEIKDEKKSKEVSIDLQEKPKILKDNTVGKNSDSTDKTTND